LPDYGIRCWYSFGGYHISLLLIALSPDMEHLYPVVLR
jgi:hypothetical protein